MGSTVSLLVSRSCLPLSISWGKKLGCNVSNLALIALASRLHESWESSIQWAQCTSAGLPTEKPFASLASLLYTQNYWLRPPTFQAPPSDSVLSIRRCPCYPPLFSPTRPIQHWTTTHDHHFWPHHYDQNHYTGTTKTTTKTTNATTKTTTPIESPKTHPWPFQHPSPYDK